jgi:hypothetical protein
MKKRLVDFWNMLKSLAMMIGSFILFGIILFGIGIIYSAMKHLFFKFDYSVSKQLKPIFDAITLSFDGIANASVGEMLNDMLKVKVKYGRWDYTISANTGINKKLGKDTWFRKLVDKLFTKDHCIDAITKEQKCYYKIM